MRPEAFCAQFGIAQPLVLAPMAGASTPALVAAVSNAGGLGSYGAAILAPEEVRRTIQAIRALTDRPFNINLFVQPAGGPYNPREVEAMLALLRPLHDELGIAPPVAPDPLPTYPAEPTDAHLDVLLDERIPVFSTTFGLLPPERVRELQQRETRVIGTATTVDEALELQESGVDAVALQGWEAGGHRGTFRGSFDDAMIGVLALTREAVPRLRVPALAAGGIMDGQGIAAALSSGAAAVQMGTAFWGCPETAAPPALLSALTDPACVTRITRALSGRPARGVRTRFLEAIDNAAAQHLYPLQRTLTQPLRAAAVAQGRSDVVAVLAGQGVRALRCLPAADLVRVLMQETRDALHAASDLMPTRERA